MGVRGFLYFVSFLFVVSAMAVVYSDIETGPALDWDNFKGERAMSPLYTVVTALIIGAAISVVCAKGPGEQDYAHGMSVLPQNRLSILH